MKYGLWIVLILTLMVLVAAMLLFNWTPKPKPHLLLELDYVGPQPKTEYTDGTTLESLYSASDIGLQINFEQNASPQFECATKRELHQMVPNMKNLRPGNSDIWYAHGLGLQSCCDGDIPGSCGAIHGAIWFGAFCDTVSTSAGPTIVCDEVREDFLVFDDSHDVGQIDSRVHTVNHELAHVLNTHHCEYGMEYVGNYQHINGTVEHLRDHRKQGPDEVAPGDANKRWCDVYQPHDDMHALKAWKGNVLCGAQNICGSLSQLREADSPDGVRLTVAPEKATYLPGEPFRINVTLERESMATPVRLYSEVSLDPRQGYLRLWAGTGDDGSSMHELGRMMLSYAKLDLVQLEGSVTAAGMDVWFWLPPNPPQTVFVTASFAGFEDPSLAIVADSTEIHFDGDPQLAPDDQDAAFALFTAPQARHFLYLLGGDHLGIGQANLERITVDFKDSLYATYSNLVLGINMALPFHHYDAAHSRIAVRPPDLARARGFLDAALEDEDRLPSSDRRLLHQARAMTYERLGDLEAPGDPPAARRLYQVAVRDFERLTGLPHPISMTREEARQTAAARIQVVKEKIGELPGP